MKMCEILFKLRWYMGRGRERIQISSISMYARHVGPKFTVRSTNLSV